MLSFQDLTVGDCCTEPMMRFPVGSSSFASLETPSVTFEDRWLPPEPSSFGIPSPDYVSFWNCRPEEEEEKASDPFFSESWTRVVGISGESKPSLEKKPGKSDGRRGEKKKSKLFSTGPVCESKPPVIAAVPPQFRTRCLVQIPLKFVSVAAAAEKNKTRKEKKNRCKKMPEEKQRSSLAPVFKKPALSLPGDRKSTRRKQKASFPVHEKNEISLSKTFWHETDVLILHPEPEEYKLFYNLYKN